MLVTVVIPVYNTAPEYFRDCIYSIVNDTDSEIEILIIDDGSDEKKAVTYQNIICDFDFIRYTHQDNHGVSSARNRGIDMASGDYLAFVDADDKVCGHFIDHAITVALDSGAEIVSGLIDFADRPAIYQNISYNKFFDHDHMIDAEKSLLVGRYLRNGISLTGSPCAKLYRTNIARTVRFDEDIRYFEDQIFNIEMLNHVESLAAISENWYIYRLNPSSAMNDMADNNYALLSIPYFNRLYDIITSKRFAEVHDELCIYALNMLYNAYFNLYNSSMSEVDIKMTEGELSSTRLVSYLVNSFRPKQYYSWKIRVKLFALRHNKMGIICKKR